MLERPMVIRSIVNLVNVNIHSQYVAIEARKNFNILADYIGQRKERSQFFFSLGYWCDGWAEWRSHDAWTPHNDKLAG
jgi:hypothetical protein